MSEGNTNGDSQTDAPPNTCSPNICSFDIEKLDVEDLDEGSAEPGSKMSVRVKRVCIEKENEGEVSI